MGALEQAMTIMYPQLRATIESAIAGFANSELQQRAWIGRDAKPSGECPTFWDAISWLFEVSGLDDGDESNIGVTLYDAQEERNVRSLMAQIDDILKKYGNKLPPEGYIRSPEWPFIIASATKCLQLFRVNDNNNLIRPPEMSPDVANKE